MNTQTYLCIYIHIYSKGRVKIEKSMVVNSENKISNDNVKKYFLSFRGKALILRYKISVSKIEKCHMRQYTPRPLNRISV